MPRVVDGDNLLGRWPGRRRSDAERHRLTHEIARFARRIRSRVVVVFDGDPAPGIRPGGDVRYSGRGCSADETILNLLRDQPRPREWTLVSDDRPLRDQARHIGAGSESCLEFRRGLTSDAGSEKPARETEVSYWLEVFGEGESEAASEE